MSYPAFLFDKEDCQNWFQHHEIVLNKHCLERSSFDCTDTNRF